MVKRWIEKFYVGFVLFWLAVGMIISMLIESTFFVVCTDCDSYCLFV